MTDESVAALEAAPEVVPPADEAAVETVQPEPESAEVSASKARREREKAARERQAAELAETRQALAEAEAKRQRLLDAAKQVAEPTEADFPDPIEHAVARASWRMAQQGQRQETEAASRAIEEAKQREQQAVGQYWAAQVADAKERYADFEKVAFTAPISNDVAKLIAATEGGADLAYALGQDHGLARQISAMHPVQAAMALGEMKAKLQQPQARKATQAPEPVNPVRGNAAPAKSVESMTAAEYAAWRDGGGTF